jgi:hypothetical protein
MADTNYTNPLGGHEVVADVLGQIRRRLSSDCNLRTTDGYSGGYSGEIKIKLRLNAVRITEVEMTVPITQSPQIQAPAPETIPAENLEPVEVDETLSIPVEDNLAEVRERIEDNSEKAIEAEAEAELVPAVAEEGDSSARTKRKYTRRAALAGAISE